MCNSVMAKSDRNTNKMKQLPMQSFAPTNDEGEEDELHPEVTLRLKANFDHNYGSFTFSAFPDTGGCLTMITLDLLTIKKIQVDQNFNIPKLVAINGKYVRTDGVVSMIIRNLHNGISSRVLIIVSPDLKNDVIIGFPQLKSLGVIPKDFPFSRFSISPLKNARAGFNEIKHAICKEFPNVIRDKLPSEPMKGQPMKITLSKDATPTRIYTARQIPKHLQAEADDIVDELLRKGIIARVDEPTEWTFFVKGGRSIHLMTDLSKLNKFIVRPTHPFPSVQHILANVKNTHKVFTKMDAIQGYHQVALDNSSSLLTTFLLPSGRYRYLCAPMGLSSSSDEWCRRSDMTIENIPGVYKLVDDYLISGDDIEEVADKIRKVLSKCRKHGLSISEAKFEISNEISFAGYILSEKGVQPDPSKIKAIAEFPTPKYVTALRSFLGMANQLGHFLPNLAALTNPLHLLLKKNVAYLWLAEHDSALERIKSTLKQSLSLRHFNPNLNTYLVNDASKLNGLGYALMQSSSSPTSPESIIQCGSRSLSSHEKNYATIELECLAMAWAAKKCDYNVRGCPCFEIVTDHRPLLGIFNKPLSEIANPRIVRMWEKLLPYQFSVTWLNGKANAIADALSRHPIDSGNDDKMYAFRSYIVGASGIVDDLKNGATNCEEFQLIKEALHQDKLVQNLPPSHPAKCLNNVWNRLMICDDDELILLDASHIFIPKPCRRKILQLLHKSHCGITKTLALA